MDPFNQAWTGGLVLLAVVTGLLVILSLRVPDPRLLLCTRWLRWFLFAVGAAYFSIRWGWSMRPFWMLAAVYFIVWALLETAYFWWLIRVYSRSEIPLFPRYERSGGGEIWPGNPSALRLRREMEEADFQFLEVLTLRHLPELAIHTSVYQSPDRRIRVQALFLPRPVGAPMIYLTLSSCGEGPVSLVLTSNVATPFGGFFPKDWSVERCPLTRSFRKLLRLHRHRLEEWNGAILEWDDDLCDQMNQHQQEMERVNREKGLIEQGPDQAGGGVLTDQGRYRVWRETWWLNYVGKVCS